MNSLFENKTASIQWLGQMGLLVRIGEVTLCIDYYASHKETRQYDPPIPIEEVEGIDAFLGTHNHSDHIDHPAWKVWSKTNPNAKFIFPRAHMEAVLADGVSEENAIGMNDGESVEIGGITIHAIAAAHEFLDKDEETGLYPYLQYVIDGNDIKIHHAGDTVRYEGMLPKIASFGNIDVEMLPINGRDAERYRRNCIGNMTFQEAADFAGEIVPGMVIPGHWDMFAANSEDPQLFEDYIDAKYPGMMTCKIPKLMEQIQIQRMGA